VLDGGGSLECTIEWAGSDSTLKTRMQLFSGGEKIGARFPEDKQVSGGVRHVATWEKVPAGQAVLYDSVQITKSDCIEAITYTFPVTIVNGQKTVLSKTLLAPTGSLEVSVSRDGLPLQELSATLHGAEPGMHSFVQPCRMEDGHYFFVALPEGAATLVLEGTIDGAEFAWIQHLNIDSGRSTQLSLDLSDTARVDLPECGQCFLGVVPEEDYVRVMAEPGLDARQRVSAMNLITLFTGAEQGSALLKPGAYRVIPYGPSPDGPPTELIDVLEDAFPLRLDAGENPPIALP
jgi:hypothetical protein